jgi:hypothetical protein
MHVRMYACMYVYVCICVYMYCECFNCISHSCDILAGDLEGGDIESLDSSDRDICMAQGGGREGHLETKKEQQLARQLGTGFPGNWGRDYITP